MDLRWRLYFHRLFIIFHGELVLIHSFSHCRHTLQIIYIVFPCTCSASDSPTTIFFFILTFLYIFLDFPVWVLYLNSFHPTLLVLFIYIIYVAVSECGGPPQAGLTGDCDSGTVCSWRTWTNERIRSLWPECSHGGMFRFVSTTHTVWGLNDGNSEDSHTASSVTAELSIGTVLDEGPGNTSLACKSNVGPVLRKATTVGYSVPSNQAW